MSLDFPANFDTLAVRAGQWRTNEGEHSEAIFTTSSFAFASAEEAAARFSGVAPGNVYSRFTNPTVRAFEQRLAALEGGASCVATASGMAAILATGMGLLQAGDHVVCSRSVFGTTVVLFDRYFRRFGIDTDFVSQVDLGEWQKVIRPTTRLLFVETPSNPLTEVADLAVLAQLAHANDALLVMDNCFCTPALQRPLSLGADIVVHSATKYLDGQGRCIGGAVVGDAERVGKEVFGFLRTAGPSMSPFNAWVFLKGLETLRLRMEAHCANALKLARWLEHHPYVEQVYYLGLESHPQHALAKRQQAGRDRRFGIDTDFVSQVDLGEWQKVIRPTTRLLFVETPSNPLTEVADLAVLAQLAHANDALLVMDNCFCTPALQRPLSLGADIVVHSATKYLDGQGRCIGGAVVGDAERVGKEVFGFLRTAGPSMSPFNAWVFLKGLETLRLRMEAHCANALKLARWLEHHPYVEQVYYLGLESHPQHALAKRQQAGFGGMVSFNVHGGREAAWRVIDNTRMISITANLGDTRTTITHPATTTHGRLRPEQRQQTGIGDGLLRISVGLEAIEDIISDLAHGMK